MFGCGVAFIGGLLFRRSVKESAKLSRYVQKPDDLLFLIPKVVMLFGAISIIAGISCALVSRDFISNNDDALLKSLHYFLLGTSIAFIILFVTFDLLNCFALICNSVFSGPIIHSSGQIYLLTLTSCLIGGFYSLILGSLKHNVQEFSSEIEREREYWKFIGIVLGIASGVINEFMLKRSEGLNIVIGDTKSFNDNL